MAEFELNAAGATEAEQKQATAYLLLQSSVGLATTGTLTGLAVLQTTTASGSVRIAAGAAVVQASVLAGASLLVNNTTKTLDVFTANPMGGLPRNDIVVFDATTATVTVIIGTPNATPDDPTVPATACALARLRHAASATTIPTAKIDSLIVLTSLNVNAGLRRLVAPAVVSANQGPISTTDNQVLTSGSTQVRSPGGQVRLTLKMLVSGTVKDDRFTFHVRDGSPTGTELTGTHLTITNTTRTSALHIDSVPISAGVARTLYVTVERATGGSGTITILPGTTLIVDEDPA